jgi:membrane protein involved in colicin uptake
MREFLRENSVPVVVSALLHGLLLLAFFVVTYLSNHQRMPTVQPLPIDAVVVDSRALQAAQKALSDRAEEESPALGTPPRRRPRPRPGAGG